MEGRRSGIEFIKVTIARKWTRRVYVAQKNHQHMFLAKYKAIDCREMNQIGVHSPVHCPSQDSIAESPQAAPNPEQNRRTESIASSSKLTGLLSSK